MATAKACCRTKAKDPEPAPAVTVDNFQLYDSLASLRPDIEISSTSALMMERETGQIIYSKDPIRSTYPASIAKIMTAEGIISRIAKTAPIWIAEESRMIPYMATGMVWILPIPTSMVPCASSMDPRKV